MAGSLADRHVSGDERLEDGLGEVLTNFIGHFVGKLQGRDQRREL